VIGSAQIAAWTAHAVFWGLLLYGWGRWLFSSFVAVLDIVLVFLIFKGDVRLT
jgi:hypothetical protein